MRWGPLVALCIVALGFYLRLRGLGDFWLNPDEGIYYAAVTDRSFAGFWAQIAANAHPPAYYLLLRAVGFLTWDFVWLRAVALVFGTAAIWIFWLVGRELGGGGHAGTIAGLVSSGLLAVSSPAITLSQMLRPYSMLLALLALALYSLLRYRRTPSTGALVGYMVSMGLALLTHYSAVFTLGLLWALVGYFRLSGQIVGAAWRRIAWAQAVPVAVLGVLYVQQLGALVGGDLMEEALGAGGWLVPWLIGSPADAWRAVLRFQAFDLPPAFQVRSAILLFAACLTALTTKDRTPAILAACGLAGAVTAAWLGLYPLGQSRHSTWLVVATLPTLGWLAGWVTGQGRRTVIVSVGVLAAALVVGGPVERLLGAEPFRPMSMEERLVRTDSIAPLVVSRLDPTEGPRTILMSQQTYNLLMPLYAGERQETGGAFDPLKPYSFRYGDRMIFVAPTWDWSGIDDVIQVVPSLPGGPAEGTVDDGTRTILLLAGGWGSGIFRDFPELARDGVIRGVSRALETGPDGGGIVRVMAVLLDLDTLATEERAGRL